MSSDIECPYCGKGMDICNDDGHGMDEEETWHEECSSCGAAFVFTMSFSFHYSPKKAPCLNGEEHDMKKSGGSNIYYPDRARCSYCALVVQGEPDMDAWNKLRELTRNEDGK